MVLLISLVVLLLCDGGGYWGYNTYGPGGGLGIVGVVLLILVLLLLLGGGGHGLSLRW